MSTFFESLSKAVSSPSPNRSGTAASRAPAQQRQQQQQQQRTPASTAAPTSTSRRQATPATPIVAGTPIRSPLLSPVASEAEREQALRDYKVTIEYKHLKNHAPGGVYLVPSLDSLRNFHGVIFVRRGPYTNGIFKFRLDLPPNYNGIDAWPQITFVSRVYNPHVDPETGALDLKSAYPTWDPHRHYLVTVLTYLKKIFYMKTFASEGSGGAAVANPEARDLAERDSTAYRTKVDECVRESQKMVFVNEEDSTAKFTEEEVCHEILRDLMKQRLKDPATMTRQQLLEIVQEAGQRAASTAGAGAEPTIGMVEG